MGDKREKSQKKGGRAREIFCFALSPRRLQQKTRKITQLFRQRKSSSPVKKSNLFSLDFYLFPQGTNKKQTNIEWRVIAFSQTKVADSYMVSMTAPSLQKEKYVISIQVLKHEIISRWVYYFTCVCGQWCGVTRE